MEIFNKAKALLDYDCAIQPRLAELTEPLKLLGISNMAYGRDDQDLYFRIGNYPAYTEHFMRHEFYKTTYADRGITKQQAFEEGKRRIFVWDNDLSGRKSVNMWNGISIYLSHADHVESWTLGGTLQDTELPNFLLNNMDLLNRYFNYFRLHAQDIIGPSAPAMKVTRMFKYANSSSSLDDQKTIDEFNRMIATNKYLLTAGAENFTVTKREIECLMYKNQGLTAKEIARVIDISYRTVETYLENARLKSGLNSIQELISVCRNEEIF